MFSLLETLRRRVSRWFMVKSLTAARREHPAPDGRRLLLIQIDGLSYPVLQEALAAGRMPFLRRQIAERPDFLYRYHPGLPTATAPFMAGLVYGRGAWVPGFEWYDKQDGRKITMATLEDTRQVEERLARETEERPLFRGGSVYVGAFAGEAEKAIFTAPRLDTPFRHLTFTAPWQILATLLLAFWTVLHLIVLTLVEVGVATYDSLRAIVTGRKVHSEFFFAAARVVVRVLIFRITVANVFMDLLNGVPIIYINMLAYDEVAHRRGPRSRIATWYLRSIDRQIEHLYEVAYQVSWFNYGIYVFSDHGQVGCRPFEWVQGVSLPNWVGQRVIGEGMVPLEDTGRDLERIQLLEKLERVAPNAPPLTRALLHAYGRHLRRLLERDGYDAGSYYAVERLVVIDGGPYAHLYLRDVAGMVGEATVEAEYPGLIGDISRLPAVGFVLTRDDQGRAVVVRNGERRSPGTGTGLDLPPTIPVDDYLENLVHTPGTGDLVLFGTPSPAGPISYVYEFGAHGGVTMEELTPFFFAPPDDPFDFGQVRWSWQLHEHFRSLQEGRDRSGQLL